MRSISSSRFRQASKRRRRRPRSTRYRLRRSLGLSAAELRFAPVDRRSADTWRSGRSGPRPLPIGREAGPDEVLELAGQRLGHRADDFAGHPADDDALDRRHADCARYAGQLPSLINNVLTAPSPDTSLLKAMGQAAASQKDFDTALAGRTPSSLRCSPTPRMSPIRPGAMR